MVLYPVHMTMGWLQHLMLLNKWVGKDTIV